MRHRQRIPIRQIRRRHPRIQRPTRRHRLVQCQIRHRNIIRPHLNLRQLRIVRRIAQILQPHPLPRKRPRRMRRRQYLIHPTQPRIRPVPTHHRTPYRRPSRSRAVVRMHTHPVIRQPLRTTIVPIEDPNRTDVPTRLQIHLIPEPQRPRRRQRMRERRHQPIRQIRHRKPRPQRPARRHRLPLRRIHLRHSLPNHPQHHQNQYQYSHGCLLFMIFPSPYLPHLPSPAFSFTPNPPLPEILLTPALVQLQKFPPVNRPIHPATLSLTQLATIPGDSSPPPHHQRRNPPIH